MNQPQKEAGRTSKSPWSSAGIGLGFMLLASTIGCAKWSLLKEIPKKPELGLPEPQMSPDAVAIDAVFVRLDEQAAASLPSAWSSVNEQAIDIHARRRLDTNGIRAGVIMGELPLAIQRWVNTSEKKLQEDVTEQAQIAADVSSHVQRLVCKAGRRKELNLRGAREGQLVLLHNDGAPKGKTYDQPSLLFEIKMYPNPDGTANLRLTPEVQYGPTKPSFIGQDIGWSRQFRREADTWKEATVETRLSPGQMLMVTGTEQPVGLGESFFWAETADHKRERVVLLIRLSKTQLNSLFDAEKTAASMRAMEGS